MSIDYTKLILGLAGGATIEAVDQVTQIAAPAATAASGSSDPFELIKVITQIIVAIGTLISLFVKPKPKQVAADPAPEQIQPLRTLPVDPCTFVDCPFPEHCTNRCVYPQGTSERIKHFPRAK
jgi:hypothetical protein